ncbi:uncharacterized protein LOC122504404 [Leptopilina heterotoma]|uniref:uncharacterized protein LOC122504404 n=1 Tax=Leptopilina heterotoma TaxID=63436 RepID=UPI001CA7D3AE|nr:uncharacterized protein LOC122504404 [Leptopilina heterotoma]
MICLTSSVLNHQVEKKPSRHKLSEPLLKTEFRIVQQDVFTKVAEASVVGIQCDGWSNRRNESIINVIVTTPEPVFYETYDTKDDSHTGEYMTDLILQVVDKIGN